MIRSSAMRSQPESAIYLLDGEQRNALPLDDRGLAYGDGLFETFRARRGEIPLWRYHLERLLNGAQVLNLPLAARSVTTQLDQMLALLREQQWDDAVVKLIVTRGSGGHGYVPPADPHPRIVYTARPFPPLVTVESSQNRGVELVTSRYRLSRNKHLAGLKHLNRLEYVMAADATRPHAGQEVLLLDEVGHLVETLHHNVFLVRNGEMLTPELKDCGVAGTLRRAVLEDFAPAINASFRTCDLTLEDLQSADEVFICNAVRGIVPVCSWVSHRWASGPVTHSLTQAVAKKWKGFYDR